MPVVITPEDINNLPGDDIPVVNDFIKKNKIKKVISVSGSSTANVDGGKWELYT